jgi:hypothetical protein
LLDARFAARLLDEDLPKRVLACFDPLVAGFEIRSGRF